MLSCSQFLLSIEKLFPQPIPSRDLAKLQSVDDVISYLEKVSSDRETAEIKIQTRLDSIPHNLKIT